MWKLAVKFVPRLIYPMLLSVCLGWEDIIQKAGLGAGKLTFSTCVARQKSKLCGVSVCYLCLHQIRWIAWGFGTVWLWEKVICSMMVRAEYSGLSRCVLSSAKGRICSWAPFTRLRDRLQESWGYSAIRSIYPLPEEIAPTSRPTLSKCELKRLYSQV